MGSSVPEKIAWVVVAILLIPILINPGSWPIALVLAGVVLAGFYASRELLDMEKSRREGERGMIADVRRRNRRDRE